MQVSPPSVPQNGEIEFQISLLNIASLGAAEDQAQELEKLLAEQSATQKH
jgi:hypothetical protein